MNGSRVLGAYLSDIRFELLKMLRTPAFAVPTLLFPTMFYVLFGILLGSARGNAALAQYTFASYGVFGAMAPGLFGFGVSLAFEREQGLMTFRQALPMPAGSYLVARMAMAMLFVAIISLMLLSLALMSGVQLGFGQASRVFIVNVLGVLPFCAIGLYVGSLVSGQAAPAIVNVIFLPMAFLSGLWMPMQFLPKFVQDLAPVWPSHHLLQLSFSAMGAPSVGSIANHVGMLAGITVLFFTLAMRRLSNGGVRLLGAPRRGISLPVRRVATVVMACVAVGLIVAGVMGGNTKVAAASDAAATSAASAGDDDGNAATDAATPAVPAGVAAPAEPVIADFDAGVDRANYGDGWFASGDEMRGGDSRAAQRVVDGGAAGTRSALEITGSVGTKIQYPFAGTAFFPAGTAEGKIMDFRGKKTLRLQARGDGRPYTILFLGASAGGIPAMYGFDTGPEWREIVVPLAEVVNLDAARVHGIVIGSMGPAGEFRLQLDGIELR